MKSFLLVTVMGCQHYFIPLPTQKHEQFRQCIWHGLRVIDHFSVEMQASIFDNQIVHLAGTTFYSFLRYDEFIEVISIINIAADLKLKINNQHLFIYH